MGRKKNKQKEIKSSPSTTPEALSEHLEDLSKNLKPQTTDKNIADLKRWIEELS